jgi:hypothetical protein
MEFVYSKAGFNAFEKVNGLDPRDLTVKNAYKKYIFNEGTAEAYLLRLNMDPKAVTFLNSGIIFNC